MSFKRFTASFIAAVVLALPFAAFAQTERGTITGVVMDSSKAAVPGVSIAVINTGTNAATNVVSSESGTYSAANLPPGTYRIEATLQGFQTSKVEGVILNAGTTARVDVTLSLGSVSESVLVVAENAVVQTEDAKVATTVSNRLIDELPLVVGGAMRSPFDLLSTVPEARGSGNTHVARRRTGRLVRRDARRHFGQHQSSGRHGRDGVPDAVARSDHRVPGRDQRLQARVRSGRRRQHHVRVEIGHEQPVGFGATGSSATTRSTRRDFSRRPRASTSRATSAGRSAGR